MTPRQHHQVAHFFMRQIGQLVANFDLERQFRRKYAIGQRSDIIVYAAGRTQEELTLMQFE